MRIALVHDDLIQHGGAERVLLELHELFPKAPIYTTVASPKWKEICKEKNIELRTSFMQYLPFVEKLNRYYSPFLFHVLAFQSFDLSDFDVVLSISSRYSHGIITKPGTVHICYMNTPGRMFWESENYFKNEEYGALKPIKMIAKPFLAPFLSHLRQWDYTAAQRVDYFVANSRTPQSRIRKYYGRDSHIIYPFIDFKFFEEQSAICRKEKSTADRKYFVVITRLLPWKKVEVAIESCQKLGVLLKIVGRGDDLERLRTLSGRNVEFFTEYISEEEKAKLLSNASGLILTQKEDFGIVPLEAMACGTPVIAYEKGGVLETVVEGVTGEYYSEQTAESLTKVLEKFKTENYDPYKCQDQAKRFDKSIFDRRINDLVNTVFPSSGGSKTKNN